MSGGAGGAARAMSAERMTMAPGGGPVSASGRGVERGDEGGADGGEGEGDEEGEQDGGERAAAAAEEEEDDQRQVGEGDGRQEGVDREETKGQDEPRH